MEDIDFLCMANTNFLLWIVYHHPLLSWTGNTVYFVDLVAFKILGHASQKKNIKVILEIFSIVMGSPTKWI